MFGVPFEVIPFKANTRGGGHPAAEAAPRPRSRARSAYEIEFPRVEGYTQAIRNRVTVDWETKSVPPVVIDPPTSRPRSR